MEDGRWEDGRSAIDGRLDACFWGVGEPVALDDAVVEVVLSFRGPSFGAFAAAGGLPADLESDFGAFVSWEEADLLG